MEKKLILLMLCITLLFGVCGCNKEDNKNNNLSDNKNSITEKDETKEESKEENNINTNDKIKDSVIKEDENKKEERPTSSNNNNNSNNSNTTNKEENNENNNISDDKETTTEDKNNDISQEAIIGTWLYDNGKKVYIFKEDKLFIIEMKINLIQEYSYKQEENRIIINETSVSEFEIKDDTLYLGRGILKKAGKDYVYPSIYYNSDIFYGTWKLESDIKTLILESGIEKTLNDEMIITPKNTDGLGTCAGSGCYIYIINFNNEKPELYTGNLCYELVDRNTLNQIKCHSDNIIGYNEWEDETLHNIIYKRVN